MMPGGRCRKALRYSKIFATRCVRHEGHGPLHIGRPLREFQAEPPVEWRDGDAREFESDRNDQWAWMETV